jgi:hypothetical protein
LYIALVTSELGPQTDMLRFEAKAAAVRSANERRVPTPFLPQQELTSRDVLQRGDNWFSSKSVTLQ